LHRVAGIVEPFLIILSEALEFMPPGLITIVELLFGGARVTFTEKEWDISPMLNCTFRMIEDEYHLNPRSFR
jgi:hypothetical protein